MQMTESTQRNLQWILTVSFISIILISLFLMSGNIIRFMQSTEGAYCVISLIFVYLTYEFVSNKTKTKIDIIPSVQKKSSPTPFKQVSRFGFFNLVASVLSVALVFNFMAFMLTAVDSPNHVIVINYNAFGEFWIEFLIFAIVGVIIIYNTILTYRNLKEWKNE